MTRTSKPHFGSTALNASTQMKLAVLEEDGSISIVPADGEDNPIGASSAASLQAHGPLRFFRGIEEPSDGPRTARRSLGGRCRRIIAVFLEPALAGFENECRAGERGERERRPEGVRLQNLHNVPLDQPPLRAMPLRWGTVTLGCTGLEWPISTGTSGSVVRVVDPQRRRKRRSCAQASRSAGGVDARWVRERGSLRADGRAPRGGRR